MGGRHSERQWWEWICQQVCLGLGGKILFIWGKYVNRSQVYMMQHHIPEDCTLGIHCHEITDLSLLKFFSTGFYRANELSFLLLIYHLFCCKYWIVCRMKFQTYGTMFMEITPWNRAILYHVHKSLPLESDKSNVLILLFSCFCFFIPEFKPVLWQCLLLEIHLNIFLNFLNIVCIALLVSSKRGILYTFSSECSFCFLPDSCFVFLVITK